MSTTKEKLSDAFKELVPSDTSNPDGQFDPDRRELRSGSSHLRVPYPVPTSDPGPVASPSQVANTAKMHSGGSSASSAASLKVLPYKHDVKKFGGADSTYSPVDFIERCEDAFLSTQVKEAKEKVGFIRQQLVDGSLPSEMMCSSSFKKPYEDDDYELFLANFLSTFGLGRDDNLICVVCASVDPVTSSLGTKNLFSAQVMGTTLAERDLRALKMGRWVVDCQMSESHLLKYLEFRFYMLALSPAERKVALALTYGPD